MCMLALCYFVLFNIQYYPTIGEQRIVCVIVIYLQYYVYCLAFGILRNVKNDLSVVRVRH